DTYTIPEFIYRKYSRTSFSTNDLFKLKAAEFTFVPLDLFIKGKYLLCRGRLKYFASVQALPYINDFFNDERFAKKGAPRPAYYYSEKVHKSAIRFVRITKIILVLIGLSTFSDYWMVDC